MKKRIELLAPAGDLEKAIVAINFNADALYAGAKSYSLRAKATNFDNDELKKIINFAHSKHKKVYVVINILCHNSMIDDFSNFIKKIIKLKPDAFIVADPFIINYISKNYPNVEIHVSTQQSITNSKSSLFFAKQKASRVILAREVNLKNLNLLIKNVNKKIDVEYFSHGALCVSYSGKCMMSNHFCLRDANVGGCAQCCRWEWELFDKKNKLISSDFNLSCKDLNLSSNIKQLIKTNLTSLKIEGRMKSIHYLATVTNVYSSLISKYYKNKLSNKDFKNSKNELLKAANRPTSTGWFLNYLSPSQMLYIQKEPKKLTQNYGFVISKRINKNQYEIISKNYLTLSDKIEILSPNREVFTIKIKKIFDIKNNEYVNFINKPMQKYEIFIDNDNLKPNDIGRIIK